MVNGNTPGAEILRQLIPYELSDSVSDTVLMANELCPGCVTEHHVVDKHGNLQHYIPLIQA